MDYQLPDHISKEEHLAALKSAEKYTIFNVLLGVTILIIVPLALYVMTLNDRLENHSISCAKLAPSSVQYLRDGGEEIPAGCGM